MIEIRAARVTAVTGASRGIGREAALALARKGDRVFALARSRTDLDALAAAARAQGLQIEPVTMDISDEGSRREAVETILAATAGYGVDVLVNNAGYGQFGPVEEVSTEALRHQLEVNVVGLHAFTQPFLADMRRRGRGRVVNVSSAAGRIATPFMGAYSASKFALEGLSDSLRVELSPFGVRVILIEPGPIRTHFGEAAERVMDTTSPYAEYERHWRKARGSSTVFERSAASVARVIVRAVETPHPRPRYTITLSAKLGTLARRIAPDLLMDLIFRRAMGKGE